MSDVIIVTEVMYLPVEKGKGEYSLDFIDVCKLQTQKIGLQGENLWNSIFKSCVHQ